MNEELLFTYFDSYDKPLNDSIYDQQDKIDFIENTLIENKNTDINTSVNLDKELVKFYSVIDRWKMHWKTKEDYEVKLEGVFNILPLKEILLGDLDFMPEKHPIMKGFTLLDFFYNEAAVGFYLDQPRRGLFYFEFDANPKPLQLDFKGYLEMLKYTKGFSYWQLDVLDISKGYNLNNNNTLKKMMDLFPDFKYEEFKELYESLRIDK